ncbi:type II and III secretion system protein family protein [Erythrobacter sp. SD-21]|uniref:type II and III secretion system protein family protein n=1 Tax=Erythrobacter sp. SD-21 TaxID=161528 RepID=UPI000153EFAD|nr:type II and III secretion system protein family protein [Erythrobacter sp. SD-21]EDL48723.1 type II secretion system protein [Erythrobacter sp. SD-21]
MKRRLTTKLLLASIALAPIAAAPTSTATAQSVTSPSQEIVLSIGRGELVNVPGNMADVFISNENVADVQVKSRRQLYLFGKSGGETTVYASNAAGDIIWAANVRVGSNIGSIDQMLSLAMPEAKINVATMGNNTVLLTGTVAAPEDAADAQSLVQAYVGEGTNVISRLRMATPLQVNLQVRIAEVSRSVVRAIGVNLATVDSSSGFQFGVGQGRGAVSQFQPSFVNPVTGERIQGPLAVGQEFEGEGATIIDQITPGSTLGAFGNLLGLDIGAALDLAETQGLVTTLSQPNLTALSGETAEFLAGGEFPIPLSQGLGTTTIEYKNYGVSLAYTPTVLANGRISIRVRPEVSELSSQGSITLNGFQVPALITRRAETTVELGSGQSFMIAGLLSNNSQNSIEKAPGLGDVPVIGNLFRSTTYRKGETELVIVVTPYLVKPVNANDIRLPTDGYLKPTEMQRLIALREGDSEAGLVRPMPSANGTGANPGISQSPVEGDEQLVMPEEARRNEKTAAATPGFSFE